MKTIVLFAILTVCFSSIITASAQITSDKVLVQSNHPLTQSMIDKSKGVFEFVFGGVLTENEKQIYQNELIKQWRGNDAETIKAIQDLVSFHDKATGSSKEQLLVVQNQLREPLIKDLRSQADKDALAKLLINAFDRIQGLNIKQGGNLPVPNNITQQSDVPTSNSIPREILGEWVESHTSNTTYTNGIGGFSAPSGEKIILHFFANGTYKAAYFVQSSMSAGCTMTVYMPSEGVFSVEGNILKMTEKTTRTISKDTCNARFNYEKNNKPGVYAYPARLERDEYGTKLLLTMNDKNHNFYFNSGQSLLVGK